MTSTAAQEGEKNWKTINVKAPSHYHSLLTTLQKRLNLDSKSAVIRFALDRLDNDGGELFTDIGLTHAATSSSIDLHSWLSEVVQTSCGLSLLCPKLAEDLLLPGLLVSLKARIQAGKQTIILCDHDTPERLERIVKSLIRGCESDFVATYRKRPKVEPPLRVMPSSISLPYFALTSENQCLVRYRSVYASCFANSNFIYTRHDDGAYEFVFSECSQFYSKCIMNSDTSDIVPAIAQNEAAKRKPAKSKRK